MATSGQSKGFDRIAGQPSWTRKTGLRAIPATYKETSYRCSGKSRKRGR